MALVPNYNRYLYDRDSFVVRRVGFVSLVSA